MTTRALLLCVLAPLVGGTLAVLLHDPPTEETPTTAPEVVVAPDAADREDGPTSGPVDPPPAPEAAPAPIERTSVWTSAAAWLEREMPFEAVGARYRVRTDVSAGTARRALRGDGSSTAHELRSAGVRVLTGGDRYAVAIDGDGTVRVRRDGLTIGTGVLDLAPGRGTVSLFARAGDLAEDHAAFRLADVSIETARKDP